MREVFAHWQRVLNHPRSVLDGKRERAIREGIKRHGVDDCKAAVDGCKVSPFHMGENERRTVYDDVTLIFRDATHTERFIELAKKGPAPAFQRPVGDVRKGFVPGAPHEAFAEAAAAPGQVLKFSKPFEEYRQRKAAAAAAATAAATGSNNR